MPRELRGHQLPGQGGQVPRWFLVSFNGSLDGLGCFRELRVVSIGLNFLQLMNMSCCSGCSGCWPFLAISFGPQAV